MKRLILRLFVTVFALSLSFAKSFYLVQSMWRADAYDWLIQWTQIALAVSCAGAVWCIVGRLDPRNATKPPRPPRFPRLRAWLRWVWNGKWEGGA